MKAVRKKYFRASVAIAGAFFVLVFLGTSSPVWASPLSPALSKCFFWNECLSKDTPKSESCDLHCDTPGTICHCFQPREECGNGGGYCYQKWPAIKLTIPINEKDVVLDLADYIGKIYNYAVAIAAIIAGVMIVIAGLQWATAVSGAQVEAAKKRIFGAGIGLLLTLGAVTVLATVSPDIVALRLPKIPLTRKAAFNPDCTLTERCVACGRTYVAARPKDAPADWKQPEGCDNVVFRLQDGDPPPTCKGCKKWSSELADQYTLTQECVGKGCGAANCGSDDTMKCRPPEAGENTNNACPSKPAGVTSVSYMCAACKGAGSSCSPNGQNKQCCSGSCGGGTCAGGKDGDACTVKTDCGPGLDCKEAVSTAARAKAVARDAAEGVRAAAQTAADAADFIAEATYRAALRSILDAENRAAIFDATRAHAVADKARAGALAIRTAAANIRLKARDTADAAYQKAIAGLATTPTPEGTATKKQCAK